MVEEVGGPAMDDAGTPGDIAGQQEPVMGAVVVDAHPIAAAAEVMPAAAGGGDGGMAGVEPQKRKVGKKRNGESDESYFNRLAKQRRKYHEKYKPAVRLKNQEKKRLVAIGKELLNAVTSGGMPSICDRVRTDAEAVSRASKHVAIAEIGEEQVREMRFMVNCLGGWSKIGFDQSLHIWPGMDPKNVGDGSSDMAELTVQYLLVLDALNFCFWPANEASGGHETCFVGASTVAAAGAAGDFEPLEYEHLACGLRDMVMADPASISADSLCNADAAWLAKCFGYSDENHSRRRPIPLAEERLRLVREVGVALQLKFDGRAMDIVKLAQGNAETLVELVALHFRGFQDQCIYRGTQVCVLKRAQIFVADVWGAFSDVAGMRNPISSNIDKLTMFADYRVPCVLRSIGILRYSEELAAKVDSGAIIPAGSEEETEVRCCTIHALELLKRCINDRRAEDETAINSVQLDWALWHKGEQMRRDLPHHKTLSIYY